MIAKKDSSLVGSSMNIYIEGVGIPSIFWKVISGADRVRDNRLYAVGSVCVIDIEGLRLKFR